MAVTAAVPIRLEDPRTAAALQGEIRALARERGALILAHSYQRPEVQDVADIVGDSLGLSRAAAASSARRIVFCGVAFMAETAAILCPDRTVLLPELEAGCSLAASITAADLRAWKADHPDAIVVSYVNTTAEVKAESDYCCTSGNAKAIIEAVPAGREILFLPDMFLGAWLEQVTGRRLTLWPGECHVHAGIRPADLARWRADAPDAELLVHPECGCSSQALAFAAEGALILSTERMVEHVRTSPARKFLVATEVGILHRLRLAAPAKEFEPLRLDAICRFMKLTTLESVRDALALDQHVISVPDDVAARARTAIRRMVEIG